MSMATKATVLLPYEITLLSNLTLDLLSFLCVLLPYEITLLSNGFGDSVLEGIVLLPYEITLLSNGCDGGCASCVVLLPYEITLLSNVDADFSEQFEFYYLMKLHYSQTQREDFYIQK